MTLQDVRSLIERGRYTDALVALHALRQSAPNDDLVDLLIGTTLVRRGELARAETHLDRFLARARVNEAGDAALEAEARVALADVYRARGDLDGAHEALASARQALGQLIRRNEPSDRALLASCMVGQAGVACARGEHDAGRVLVEHALEIAPDTAASVRVRALLTLASCQQQEGAIREAERALRRASDVAGTAKLPRELADTYLAYAQLVGDAGDALEGVPVESPAAVLARAQSLLREHGSLADLERVREAFQRFGRRVTDRATPNQVHAVIQDLRRARTSIGDEMHRLVDTVHVSAPQLAAAAAAVGNSIDAGLQAISEAEARVLAATQAMMSERETSRILLDLIRTLNQLGDYQELLRESCRMAAQLTGADRALVALTASGGLVVRETLHMADGSGDGVARRALDQVFETRRPALIESETATSRGDEELELGSAIVVPLRSGNRLIGAIYVDKALCGGVFTSRDLDLLAIFAAQVGTMLQNVRAAEELRLAARGRAATLEAISDGVVSLDPSGSVTSINARAARILGIASNARPNISLFQDLSFLRATLERGDEFDGRVTRIGGAEYVVNARVVRSDQRDVAGIVVTLTEMKRAKSIAQRIVGSHARYSFADLIGEAASLRGQLKIAEAAARSESNVLITGESGTGKEVVAQAIHNASARTAGPFVGINCSAIPRELLESELFGYEGGAFTGARRGGQPGKFELAEGGTILLDEIGDMPLEMQAKLLRVLQERRVLRIGGTREVTLDARVIATTHRDLDEAAAHGHFRADLLFRLKVIHISLPSLRERSSDIPVLVEHFLQLFAARLGKPVHKVAPSVMSAFQRYPWPGNIRELENVLESEVSLSGAGDQTLDRIPEALRRGKPVASTLKRATLTFEEAERELLVQALTRHAGSIPDVAKSLGVSRGTVYNKLHRYGIDADVYR